MQMLPRFQLQLFLWLILKSRYGSVIPGKKESQWLVCDVNRTTYCITALCFASEKTLLIIPIKCWPGGRLLYDGKQLFLHVGEAEWIITFTILFYNLEDIFRLESMDFSWMKNPPYFGWPGVEPTTSQTYGRLHCF